jgi:uncharacterized BrkB/YihY/UPF0761 family membrane protein
MNRNYIYFLAFICIAVGVTLTYLGYEYGINDSEEGDSDNAGDIAMLVFGILFIVLFFLCLFFLYRYPSKKKK